MAETSIEQQIFETLFRILRTLRHHMHAKDLTPGETFILSHIHRRKKSGGVRVSDIASKMMVTTSGVTQFVKGLESRGLVERKRSDTDRRVVMLTTTPKGDDLMAASMRDMVASFSRFVESHGQEESLKLRDSLLRVAQFLEEDSRVNPVHSEDEQEYQHA